MRMKDPKFPNLYAEMARIGLMPSEIGKEIGLNPNTVRCKLNDQYPWTDDEMKGIRDKWFPGFTLDYLFYCEGDAYEIPRQVI